MANYTTIDDPSVYFQTILYSGNETARSITLDGNSDLQPDMVWLKQRNRSDPHILMDSVRGTSSNLSPNIKNAQQSFSNMITSFDSDGFSVGNNVDVNRNSTTFVAWNWKESATAGFDMVLYTGNDTARTISHSLSAVPTMMIIKCRDVAKEWTVFTASQGNGKFFELDGSTAIQTATNRWNDTSPTSSVFTVGVDSSVNGDTQSYIAYLFADKQGFSKVGSAYSGNGNDSGSFIYTGFSVGWLMIKRVAGSTGAWLMVDSKREPFNSGASANELGANEPNGENDLAGDFKIDLLSNGFKLRDDIGDANAGAEYIYMAFAESPFVTSTGVPTTAR
jgi:hypothetical protein